MASALRDEFRVEFSSWFVYIKSSLIQMHICGNRCFNFRLELNREGRCKSDAVPPL